METFIPGVGPASENEPVETKNLIKEITETFPSVVFDGLNNFNFLEDDDESEWILFGVGGPA